MDCAEKLVKLLRKKDEKKGLSLDNLETEKEYRERWISIYVIYFTMFLISLGFSIVVTGVWPYLDKLDPTAGKEFMGYVVAANPLGQMLFSPLLGWWANKLGSIRIPVFASLVVFAVSSAVYSSLDLFDQYQKYWMLWARFFVGVSSASVAACRSYLSAATRLSERTSAVSMISLAQVLGFVFGPALQALVVPLGSEGVWLIENKLRLNMYTAAGWINVFLAVLNIIMFLPSVFKEHRIAVREAMLKVGKLGEEATWKQSKLDYWAAWTLIIAFFVTVFNFMLLETLATPLTMDQFAWTKAEALYYMGIFMSIGAVLACVTFVAIGPLCRMFPEVKVIIWGGFFFMVLGRASYIPWGDTIPQIYNDTLKLSSLDVSDCDNGITTIFNSNITTPLNETEPFQPVDFLNNTCIEEELVGCPSSQEWCYYTPVMTISQFIFGFILTVLGYPIGVTLIQTIFSKILGPRPQGVWMGLITGAGCLSRVSGPIFVTFIYTKYGTIWTFGMTTVVMIVSMIWLHFFRKRLLPPVEKVQNEQAEEMQELNSQIDLNAIV